MSKIKMFFKQASDGVTIFENAVFLDDANKIDYVMFPEKMANVELTKTAAESSDGKNKYEWKSIEAIKGTAGKSVDTAKAIGKGVVGVGAQFGKQVGKTVDSATAKTLNEVTGSLGKLNNNINVTFEKIQKGQTEEGRYLSNKIDYELEKSFNKNINTYLDSIMNVLEGKEIKDPKVLYGTVYLTILNTLANPNFAAKMTDSDRAGIFWPFYNLMLQNTKTAYHNIKIEMEKEAAKIMKSVDGFSALKLPFSKFDPHNQKHIQWINRLINKGYAGIVKEKSDQMSSEEKNELDRKAFSFRDSFTELVNDVLTIENSLKMMQKIAKEFKSKYGGWSAAASIWTWVASTGANVSRGIKGLFGKQIKGMELGSGKHMEKVVGKQISKKVDSVLPTSGLTDVVAEESGKLYSNIVKGIGVGDNVSQSLGKLLGRTTAEAEDVQNVINAPKQLFTKGLAAATKGIGNLSKEIGAKSESKSELHKARAIKLSKVASAKDFSLFLTSVKEILKEVDVKGLGKDLEKYSPLVRTISTVGDSMNATVIAIEKIARLNAASIYKTVELLSTEVNEDNNALDVLDRKSFEELFEASSRISRLKSTIEEYKNAKISIVNLVESFDSEFESFAKNLDIIFGQVIDSFEMLINSCEKKDDQSVLSSLKDVASILFDKDSEKLLKAFKPNLSLNKGIFGGGAKIIQTIVTNTDKINSDSKFIKAVKQMIVSSLSAISSAEGGAIKTDKMQKILEAFKVSVKELNSEIENVEAFVSSFEDSIKVINDKVNTDAIQEKMNSYFNAMEKIKGFKVEGDLTNIKANLQKDQKFIALVKENISDVYNYSAKLFNEVTVEYKKQGFDFSNIVEYRSAKRTLDNTAKSIVGK